MRKPFSYVYWNESAQENGCNYVKKSYLFFSSFLEVSYIIGVATNNEEYVPTATPIISANMNPLIESPPKVKIASITNNVVKEVLIVLPKVELNALSTTSLYFQVLWIRLTFFYMKRVKL